LRVTFGLCGAVANISTVHSSASASCGSPAARAGETGALVAITDNNYCRRRGIQDLRTYQETAYAGQNFRRRSFRWVRDQMQHQRTVNYSRHEIART
jgi:hypothetical protein